MPRIAPLEPPYAPDIQEQFDQIMKGAPPLILFRTIAASKRAWSKFRAGSLLDRGPLSLREREIVIDRTTALNGCEYEWGVHVATFATQAGLVSGAADAGWSEAERGLLSAVDALHAGATLSKAEFDGLRAHYDDSQILEILLLCGFYRTVSCMANALDLPLEPGAARFPVAEGVDGTR